MIDMAPQPNLVPYALTAYAAHSHRNCRPNERAAPWDINLGDLGTPAHIWHGSEDPNVPVAHARVIAARFPTARLHIVDGVSPSSAPCAGERLPRGRGVVDSVAMQGSMVEVTTPDGVAGAYLARPDERPHRGVLFIMDAYGLRPTVEEMVDRIAADGYVVLAPNVFYRAGPAPVLPMPEPGDPEQRASFFQSVRPLIEQLTPERLAADGGAYLDYLSQVASPGPVAITGYCMGARVAWRIAAAHPDRVGALAGFHAGGLVTDAPDSPHLSAPHVKAEMYFGFADQDRSMTAEQIATFDRALEESGARFRSEVYSGAQHGFTMADTAAFNEQARERHFRELRGLLDRALR